MEIFETSIEKRTIILKLSEKGYTSEEIENIFKIDEFFATRGIGKTNEFIEQVLDEKTPYNEILMNNISLFLNNIDSRTVTRLIERLRCNTIREYFLYFLSGRDLEQFCNTYENSDHGDKSITYRRDEDGYIILEPGDYLATSINETQGSRMGKWYLLSNGTRAFIKNIYSPREAYAEIIAEEIAKQMGIPYARYDLIKIGNIPKIASINFLGTGEELIHGSDILTVPSIKDITIICPIIRRVLGEKKYKYLNLTAEDINRIVEDFLKITIFDKIVSNWDRNPGNWGIIISPDKKVRLAPEFDNNQALNRSKFDSRKDMSIGESHNLEELLDYCLEVFSSRDELFSFLNHCLSNVNPQKAFESIFKQKGIRIPESDKREIGDCILYGYGTSINVIKRWLEKYKKIKSTPDNSAGVLNR